MSELLENHITERVGRLEESQKNLDNHLVSIERTVEEIRKAIGASQRTNWSLVISAALFLGAAWAAAIRPINNDQQRYERDAEILAEAVKIQNTNIVGLTSGQVAQDKDIATLQRDVKNIQDNGAPITHELAYRVSQLEVKQK